MNPSPTNFPTPVSPYSTEVDAIEFHTKVAWSAYDLGTALNSLDTIYSTFILARHLAVGASQRLQRSAEELEHYWRLIEREGPPLEFISHEWSRFMRRYGPRAASLLFPFGPLRSSPSEQIGASLTPSELDYYLRNPSEYMPASHELRIKRIEIASPGGFTLAGLGEPIREVREFIKDIWYRNRQEREKGDLEILKQKLELVGQGNLPPQQVQVLAMSTIEDAEEVGRLIEGGQLQLEGQDIGASQLPKKRSKRRPRPKAPTDEQIT